MNVVQPKFMVREVPKEMMNKLILSCAECEEENFKEIRCVFCDFPVATISPSATGHFWVKCQKCKAQYPINPAYFHRARSYKRPDPFTTDKN